jgi:hypothetical protein
MRGRGFEISTISARLAARLFLLSRVARTLQARHSPQKQVGFDIDKSIAEIKKLDKRF